MYNRVLINHLYVPKLLSEAADTPASQEALGTVIANLAYFGFAPSLHLLSKFRKLSSQELKAYWTGILPALKQVTGDDRQMGDFVVYKNFPKEVLDMSRAQYWLSQILMYLGAPNEFFTQPEQEREPLQEALRLKVLNEAPDNVYETIFNSLKKNKFRWTDQQQEEAEFLLSKCFDIKLDLSEFGFKENGLHLISLFLKASPSKQKRVHIQDATDVLRLAAALSDQDVSLRNDLKIKRFKRSERRMMLSMLEDCKNLDSDMVMRPALWKRFLSHLHPGDYGLTRVQKAYDNLYNGRVASYNADLERKIHHGDPSVLELVSTRPGDFARRLHKLYEMFGEEAVETFASVMDRLDTQQILKLLSYAETINNRKVLIYPPKGSWRKAQVKENTKLAFSDAALSLLRQKAGEIIQERLKEHCPHGVDLDIETLNVKLQTNDQKLAAYGRGTSFKIPDNVTFIRTASYWACSRGHNVWFDNGFTFFDRDWNAVSHCTWDHARATGTNHWNGANSKEGAIFSGDPTNSKDMKGRACQMIDLYIDNLKNMGVRYALWGVLCYSNIPFSEAEDVLATLQWGEKPESGKLYEPARAQMVFPLKSEAKTSYLAYIDLETRELIYMDADLGGSTQSMRRNQNRLEERMPAYQEYLTSLPSVYDLFSFAPEGDMPVVYTDHGKSLKDGQKAYVFKPENAENNFTPLDVATVLSS